MTETANKKVQKNPEVTQKAARRRFTSEYKRGIAMEADNCRQPGEIGALLRREGLYSSHLTSWRRQRDAGALQALGAKKRGRRAKRKDPMAAEIERLQRENQRLTERLRQAETIIEVQKKVSEMLEISAPNQNDDETI